MKQLNILIADDHAMIRQGVRSVLESQPGWTVCGEAENGRAAVELARNLRPQVAILDITMPDLNGVDTIRLIKNESPETLVLMLTMHESEALAEQVLKAGAQGYLLKSDASEMLPVAIRRLMEGKNFVSRQLQNVKSGKSDGESNSLSRLTPRERQTVQLLGEGKSNKQIADALGISTGTVETHRKNILSKLHLHSTAELVRFAIRNNLAQP